MQAKTSFKNKFWVGGLKDVSFEWTVNTTLNYSVVSSFFFVNFKFFFIFNNLKNCCFILSSIKKEEDFFKYLRSECLE